MGDSTRGESFRFSALVLRNNGERGSQLASQVLTRAQGQIEGQWGEMIAGKTRRMRPVWRGHHVGGFHGFRGFPLKSSGKDNCDAEV